MLHFPRFTASILALTGCLLTSAANADSFKVCWSIYAGWMPWGYAADAKIIDKWADKYGIKIEIVQINDYVESINQYTIGQFDACAMTNMDALTIPAAGGVDSTALIVGDFSNGNDGIVMKGENPTLAGLKGQKIHLVELSVSHYLLARALESVGLTEANIKVVNTADADIVGAYSSKDITSVVTWNPQLQEITAQKNATQVFDSSKIPGEIIDLLVVNTKVLQKNPALGKALVGAWYEIMHTMSNNTPASTAAKTAMAQAAATDLAGYETQLKTTHLFYNASDAVAFTQSEKLLSTMKKVAEFSFEHGLLGDGAPNAGFIGIETPAGIYGNQKNIQLRFDATYMQLAAEQKL